MPAADDLSTRIAGGLTKSVVGIDDDPVQIRNADDRVLIEGELLVLEVLVAALGTLLQPVRHDQKTAARQRHDHEAADQDTIRRIVGAFVEIRGLGGHMKGPDAIGCLQTDRRAQRSLCAEQAILDRIGRHIGGAGNQQGWRTGIGFVDQPEVELTWICIA